MCPHAFLVGFTPAAQVPRGREAGRVTQEMPMSYSEGWEQNGLYEFFRAKMRARRRKGQEKRNR